MAADSDGCLLNFDNENGDEMLWEEVRKKTKVRQRSGSSSDESVETVVKKSKADGGSLNAKLQDEVWKVIIVFDQKEGPDLHPIHITKAIEKDIGKIKHARLMGNGRILIFANSEEQQKNILKKDTLNNLKITSHIPGITTKARGVISGIPTSVTIEEIKESLKQYDLVEAKRLMNGKEKTESLSVLLCFKKELPVRIQMGYISYLVRQYIPPPIRCYKCQRFGHVAVQCRGKPRCAKCGGEHEYGKCGDKAVLKCCNCGGDHSAAYGGCEKQKEAREAQKLKITNKVSYAEALKEIVNEKEDSRSDVPTCIPEQEQDSRDIEIIYQQGKYKQNE